MADMVKEDDGNGCVHGDGGGSDRSGEADDDRGQGGRLAGARNADSDGYRVCAASNTHRLIATDLAKHRPTIPLHAFLSCIGPVECHNICVPTALPRD